MKIINKMKPSVYNFEATRSPFIILRGRIRNGVVKMLVIQKVACGNCVHVCYCSLYGIHVLIVQQERKKW